jgi:hypothetical protein
LSNFQDDLDTGAMPLDSVIERLRRERALIQEAIALMQRLEAIYGEVDSVSAPRKRGRPPGSKNRPKPPKETAG